MKSKINPVEHININYTLEIIKVREYSEDGNELFGYKLYKDNKLIARGKATTENIFNLLVMRYKPKIIF